MGNENEPPANPPEQPDQYADVPDPYADMPDQWAELSDKAIWQEPEADERARDEEHRRYLARAIRAKRLLGELEGDPEATDADWRSARKRYDEAQRDLLDYESEKGYPEE